MRRSASQREAHFLRVALCCGAAAALCWCQAAPGLASDAGRLCSIAGAFDRPDGSAKPPGDVVEVTVRLAAGIKDARLELEAYLVSGEAKETQTAIAAKTPQHRRKSGDFVEIATLVTAGSPTVAPTATATKPTADGATPHALELQTRMVIPYAELVVPKGQHLLGYVVLLVVDGETVDVRPIPLSKLTVTDQVRNQIEISRVVARSVTRMEVRDLLVVDGERLTRDTIEVPVEERVMEEVTSAVSVGGGIPGEFIREGIFGAAPGSMADQFREADKRTIFFATNRKENPAATEPAGRFLNESAPQGHALSYGAYQVSVPRAYHTVGRVEQPERRLVFWRQAADPARHFVVLHGDPASQPRLSLEEFSRRLDGNDTLVYVHGFNNSFEDALVRAAQLQHDLRFPGNMVVFSWPSAGDPGIVIDFLNETPQLRLAYDADKTQAELSAPFLARALRQIMEAVDRKNAGGRTHVLAHSMGNYVLLNALNQLAAAEPGAGGPELRLGEVILAAPDVTAGEFLQLQQDLFAVSRRVTLYCSLEDKALYASQKKAEDKPVGLQVLVLRGRPMDTIHAAGFSEAFYDFNDSHSYFGNAPPVITDISYVVNQHKPPAERLPLSARRPVPKVINAFYWEIAR